MWENLEGTHTFGSNAEPCCEVTVQTTAAHKINIFVRHMILVPREVLYHSNAALFPHTITDDGGDELTVCTPVNHMVQHGFRCF